MKQKLRAPDAHWRENMAVVTVVRCSMSRPNNYSHPPPKKRNGHRPENNAFGRRRRRHRHRHRHRRRRGGFYCVTRVFAACIETSLRSASIETPID